MKRHFILVAIALGGLFASCDSSSSDDVKPAMDAKVATEKMMNQRAKIAEGKNSTKHLVLPANSVSKAFTTKSSGLDYINKYKEYYKDYSFTKGKVKFTWEDKHSIIEVNYGDETDEYGKKLKGKFTIDIVRENGKTIEKRIWDLEIDGSKVKGEVVTEITREGYAILYKGKTNDFKIVTPENETITEVGEWTDKYEYRKNRVKTGNYETKSSKGINCKYEITKDLVFDMMFSYRLPIAGIENVKVTEGDSKAEMIVDFGNGVKDYKVTVTTNGKTEEIDYSNKWK